MAKNIPAKEFKAAVKALNAVLKANEEDPIRVVGVKKEVVQEAFTNVVLDFIETDRSEELPDEAIDIYNDYIANDEGGDDEGGDEAQPEDTPAAKGKAGAAKGKAGAAKGKPAAKGKGSRTRGKGKAGATSGKKSETKTPRGPSVVEMTVEMFMKEGLRDNASIVKKLEKKFPGRNIASTVSSAMCVLKHVEKHI